MSQVCALSFSSRRLGAAIYDEDEKEVKLLDMAEDDDFLVLERLLREVKPSHILVNRSQSAEYQMHLRKKCSMVSGMEEEISDRSNLKEFSTSQFAQTQITFVNTMEEKELDKSASKEEGELDDDDSLLWQPSITFLPDIAFSFGLACKKLEQIFGAGVKNKQIMASFRLDFTSTNMIRSLGALLRFMEQQGIGGQTFENLSVEKMTTLVFDDCIEVDSTTLRALEIFYSDYTPETIRKKFVWGNNRREGMSIFKLCNLCRSSPGKQKLRNWFERPINNLTILSERHEAISYLHQDCNVEVTSFIYNYVKDIFSIKPIFRRMRRGNLPVSDWKNLFSSICAMIKIGEFLTEKEVNLAFLKGKLNLFGTRLQQVACLISEVIDFQETLAENRVVIKQGIDKDLDNKKKFYENLPDELTSVAKQEADEISIQTCTVAYLPIVGYLLMTPASVEIPASSSMLVELIFTSEGMSYFKTKRMRLLDENIGDIKMDIIDAETNIVLNLQKRLLGSRQIVLDAIDLAATLDCFVSLSQVARKYNWICPKFVEETILSIKEARHPIAEHLCKTGTYVSNPIISSTEDGKIKILFGPNSSGKSVYLKMIGAIVYLASVGSFVPAYRATIGKISRIMSRLYTVDSVLDGMSSFANDLKQMSRAVARSDQNSLLIIDEFGKGTQTEVGLSLLASCLNYWLEGPVEKCPHVVVASHFYVLPELLTDPNKLLKYQTMGVSRLDDDTLDFHFNLVDGITDFSYATFTALKMGIPREVVERSEEVYLNLRSGGLLSDLTPIKLPELSIINEELNNEEQKTNKSNNINKVDETIFDHLLENKEIIFEEVIKENNEENNEKEKINFTIEEEIVENEEEEENNNKIINFIEKIEERKKEEEKGNVGKEEENKKENINCVDETIFEEEEGNNASILIIDDDEEEEDEEDDFSKIIDDADNEFSF
uniref:DNA mismatch repair proteins mutS family domain-containing protein n=1 Tax=Meloidogyne incognita TaxID=6306 RepID=A0A914NCD9_MELIC